MLMGAGALVQTLPDSGRWFGSALLGIAGLYQFTPLKDVCLRHCRSPLGQLIEYGGYKGVARDLRVRLHHGGYCVGCCWGLMVVLIAVGVTNLPAMAALAAAIFLEKLWRRGVLLRK
jgi:predicted metal-binding membrane protein